MATYILPDFLGQIHTRPEYYSNYLWIKFTGKTLDSVGPFVRSKNSIQAGSRIGSWQFIAPNEIMENVSHDWEEFESIGTRAAQKSITMRHAGMEAKQVGVGVSDLTKTLSKGSSADVSSIMGNMNKVGVPEHKVDTTLIYKDTKRRAYDFTFEFSFWNDNDPEEKIFKPIRELQKWTCPDMDKSGFTKIDFPAVFNIKTVNSDLINIRYGVITAVQPTWMSPFIDGYPSRVSLTISFQDMQPLYRSRW